MNYSNIQIKSLELHDRIPLEDESVDAVTLLAALEHFEKDFKIIQESKRILKPDGLLLITTPSKKSEFIIKFLAYQLQLVSKEEVMDHKRYYTIDKLCKLLTANGFINPKIEPFEFGFNLFCCAKK